MRRVVFLGLVGWLQLSAAGLAQSPAQQPNKPQPETAAPAQEPAAAAPDASRSLFAPTWRQFQIGGRWTSVTGDPARWQRYEDNRDGLLFTDARFAGEGGGGAFHLGADNVGWRDQRYFGDYERPGQFVIKGLWDSIPQFYSVDTATPYSTASAGALVVDDGVQASIQAGRANLNAYVPLAGQFDLRERREIGQIRVVATPTQTIDLKAAFNTTRHVGELPWGVSFGFGNDVEVALPYDSRTNDFTVGAEWTNNRSMFRVAYDGSWFDNLDDTLLWDNPLRLTDSSSAPGRGRMALWPSNSAQTVSASGYARFAHRTQLTGFVSYGVWSNDEPLQPFTINTALPQLTLPRATAEAEAQVFSTNLSLVSRPIDDWRFSARVRRYDYDNQAPPTPIPQFINYDTSIRTSATGGPEPFAHSRTTFTADATWSGLSPFAVTLGYTRNDNGHRFRIFEDTGENVLRVTADAVGTQWLSFRTQYEFGDRTGSGLDEELLVEIGEQPRLRHYDIANRTRNRFTGQVDVTPSDPWLFSVSAGFGQDDYDDSYFGLQESTFRVLTFSVDFQQPNGFGAGGGYDYERYAGFQQSRSASPGAQQIDPSRDWTADSTERVHYFSVYLNPPRIWDTEARLSYEYSHSKGHYLYGIVPGGPLPVPSQLPDVFNKLQELRVDVRHRLSNRLTVNVSYRYEPFRVYDFAFDKTVIDGIVQPSSLILGYLYRPYTANQAVVGLSYFW
jgi:MtrB/PioB family decaheme-associated outer membrane protein